MNPTPAAMRAAEAIGSYATPQEVSDGLVVNVKSIARLIDRETGLPELIAIREATEAVLHELTIGEASEGGQREVKRCADLLRAALANAGGNQTHHKGLPSNVH